MKSNGNAIKQIVNTCINAVPQEKHISILREMFGFEGIFNFPQTIKGLISLDQMDVFGISSEMQVILRHINQLKMLREVSSVRRLFQKEYEKLHKRTVAVVKIGDVPEGLVDTMLAKIASELDKTHDIVYQKSSVPGVSVHFGGKVVDYTSEAVARMLKSPQQ